ncbi:MAG: hypothetical protein VR65_15775 [Desulfobulbaceae bacterium BRH_c16a]|nr:MAG: hypothetical protein VR65_15775 [Desulfobulbaceae bacterium BRH_c16a]
MKSRKTSILATFQTFLHQALIIPDILKTTETMLLLIFRTFRKKASLQPLKSVAPGGSTVIDCLHFVHTLHCSIIIFAAVFKM